MNRHLKQKIQKIKLLILDVDGVLTEGKIVLGENGEELKVFDVLDGYGLVLFRKAGYKTAIISARKAQAVTHRAKDIGIDRICQDAYPKINAYEALLKAWMLKDDEVCFMGDDLPDMAVLKRVGFAVAVSNAVLEVKEIADYVTKRSGGRGAIREVVELILNAQGKWKRIVSEVAQ